MFNASAFLTLQAENDRAWMRAQVRNLPGRFQSRLMAEAEKLNAGGGYAGNAFIREQGEKYRFPLPIAASNDELIGYAQARADECFRLAGYFKESGAVLAAMIGVCERLGVNPPQAKTEAGMRARLVCPLWWRRAIRKAAGRAIETTAISLGLVHRRAGAYASDETVQRRGQQKRRNRALLESVFAVNELGQEYSLQALSDLGVSNPAIRRGELMTRIAGFEYVAHGLGHAGEFYTATAPSRYHARLSKTGQANPKYDGNTPRQAQEYLRGQWAKVRAALHREEVQVYGFRVVEAHHDGTPHWHLLLFMAAEHVKRVRQIMKKYALEHDADEAGAQKQRFKAVAIDRAKGSAAGYIAKYIAKNIDGYGVGVDLEGLDAVDSAARVDAWAACWGIRQFQQIGGAPVTVWRELRRMEAGEGDSALDRAARAADAGDWAGFLQAMGGIRASRRDAPVKLWRQASECSGRYGDTVEKVAGVLDETTGEQVATRVHVWEVSRGQRGVSVKVAPVMNGGAVRPLVSEIGPVLSAPWSPVNNCTEEIEDGGRTKKFRQVAPGEVEKEGGGNQNGKYLQQAGAGRGGFYGTGQPVGTDYRGNGAGAAGGGG